MQILIKNIKTLVQARKENVSKVSGADLNILPCIENAWLAIDKGLIADFGSMDDFPGITDWKNLEVIDAAGKMVFPSWVDSHTHLVYAGSREMEFVDRINGLTYEEIAAKGGGILNSAELLKHTSEEELIKTALVRLNEIMTQGTGAVEIKSGYGLNTEAELKMLRVIKKLKDLCPLTIKSTFLGAHAVPANLRDNKDLYIDLSINEMIPKVAEEKLADFIDVFCEENYFTEEESIKILEAGKKYGMIPKVHAEQLSNFGGVRAGIAVGAISVDHLEFLGDEEIFALQDSKPMPVILPGAQFFLGLQHPPARKMIKNGLPIAIASDYNPGSSPSGNMNLMQSLCCILYKMTPNETINASTINGAYAMQVSDQLGSITIGKKANVFITKEMHSLSSLAYAYGSNPVEQVILNGIIQKL